MEHVRRRRGRAHRHHVARADEQRAGGSAPPARSRSSAGRSTARSIPRTAHNRIIQDIGLAPRNARGRVEYVATFALAKPVDMARAARVLLYQVVNRGNGQAVASPEGYVSLVSGWQGDVIPTPSNQTIVVPIAKQKDGSPITGPVLARFIDVPDGATTAQIRLASLGPLQPYPPVDLAQPQATLTWHTSENLRRRAGCVARGPACRLGVRRLHGRAVAGHARSLPDLPEGRLPRRPDLRARLHGPGPPGAGRRPRGDARRRVVLPPRREGRRRHAEPGRGRDRPRDQRRRLAVGQLHPHLHPSRLQPGRAQPHRLGRRVPAHRGAADADEPALRVARRRRRHVRAGKRRRGLVDALRRRGARPEGRGPARSLHGDEDVSEGDRSVRLGGVLGPAHVARPRRHRRQARPAAPRQRPALLLSGDHARRRARRVPRRRRACGRLALHAARQSEPGGGSDAGADAGPGGVGDEGHAAAGEPLPDAGERRPRPRHARRDRPPGHPGPAVQRPDPQSGRPLRLRRRLRRRGSLGRDVGRTAADPGRRPDAGAARQRGRQRNGRRPVRADAGAARDVSRLEHGPLGVLRGAGLRLPGRVDSVREDEGRTARQPRSAPVARRALRHARGLRGAGQARGRTGGP